MSAPTQAPCPTFEPLLAVNVSMGDKHVMQGSFGSRTNKPLLGGEVRDPAGNVVGRIVPNTSVSHGVVDVHGTYHPSVTMTIQWDVDGTFAYLNLNGVGAAGTPTSVHIHLEADISSSYFWLSRKFLIGKVSHSPDGSRAFFDIFVLKNLQVGSA